MKPQSITASSAFRSVLLGLLAAFYVGQSLLPAWSHVKRDGTAMDYATFHYAVEEALDGGDPYDTSALTQRGRSQKTRPIVFPYLYPPAFLPFMVWSAALSLHTAYMAWFWVNQVILVLLALVFRRWLGASWLLLAFLFATFTPILSNAAYGQVNLLVLLFVAIGLWRVSGAALSLAAMFKMSPALYLVDWVARGMWRPPAVFLLSSVALGVLSLSVVTWDAQLTFLTEVLPSFSTGAYNGLVVPIAFPVNHSLPDLFNQLWPGPAANLLDPKARVASTAVTVLAISALAWISRRIRSESLLGAACMSGAWTALITVLPVYAWEHHLVFLLLPLVAAGTAAVRGHLGRPGIAFLVLAYVCVAWPIEWLVVANRSASAVGWWLQESKFAGTVLLGVICAVASTRSSTHRDA